MAEADLELLISLAFTSRILGLQNPPHAPPQPYVTAAHSRAWHSIAWHGMAQYGMTWHSMAWHSIAWHSIA